MTARNLRAVAIIPYPIIFWEFVWIMLSLRSPFLPSLTSVLDHSFPQEKLLALALASGCVWPRGVQRVLSGYGRREVISPLLPHPYVAAFATIPAPSGQHLRDFVSGLCMSLPFCPFSFPPLLVSGCFCMHCGPCAPFPPPRSPL